MYSCVLLTGLYWYTDKLTCNSRFNRPTIADVYVDNACWLKGLYLHKELMTINTTYHYGITYISITHINNVGNLCGVESTTCRPMTPVYITTYQWMPVFLLVLTFVLHIPYYIFQNDYEFHETFHHHISHFDANIIFSHYFKSRSLSSYIRCYIPIIINVSYLLVNIFIFECIDRVLFGGFKTYGTNMLNFKHYIERDNMGAGNFPSPADKLLMYRICW